MLLSITLTSVAAAAIITIWLGMRIGSLRRAHSISHGDGGVPALARRMRAQLNFVEYTPFILLLVAAIEMSRRGGVWLSIVVGIYMLARIAHAIGMDQEEGQSFYRIFGIGVTMLTLLGLSIVAVLIAAGIA